MNKGLKWVLIGLGIAVVVLGIALVAFRGFMGRPELMMGGRQLGFHHPFGGMMFGMGLFMLFRVLLGGVVLGLAVFGLITLFRHQKSTPVNTISSVPPEATTQPLTAEVERNCIKCSKPLQADWINCPYCGKKQ